MGLAVIHDEVRILNGNTQLSATNDASGGGCVARVFEFYSNAVIMNKKL